MATYEELDQLPDDPNWGPLYAKIRFAVTVKAQDYLDGVSPTQQQVDYAKNALANPDSAAQSVQWYVLAANKGATTAQILAATDTAVQTNVDAAIDAVTSV